MILKRSIFTVAVLALLIMPLTANAGIVIDGHLYNDITVSTNFVNVGTLSITGDSCINLTDEALPTILPHYVLSGTTDYATLYGYVLSGRNGGTWNGPGIISDMVAADTAKRGLAVLTAAEYNALYPAKTFHGLDTTSSAALVQYTYRGDFNLDSLVNSSDISKVKATVFSLAHSGHPAQDWANGDTNYNGVVDSTDISFVKAAVFAQAHSSNYPLIPTGYPGSGNSDGFTPVPEPSIFVLGFLAVACFLGFRKFST